MQTEEELDADHPRFARITEDGLDALRKLIGVPITDSVEPWCTEVTRDNVRHYAHGIGDDNPLWCDPAYAASTTHGAIIAPPSFVFPLDRVFSGYVGGLPGVHAMWSGASTTWHRPFCVGEEIRTTAALKDLIPHETRFAGRAIQQIYHVEWLSGDDLVAEGDSWCFRTERDAARELGTKYDHVKDADDYQVSSEVLARVREAYDSEQRRGAEPRYFEDVSAGDALPRMVKGPMTVTGFIAFAQGWGGLYIRANRIAHQLLKKHPNLGIPNSYGVPDVPERVHWDDDLAALVGTPRAYDYGPERCSWLLHHLTDWMGDDGFVVSHTCQIRRHNVVGEIIWIDGEVTKVEADASGVGLVHISQRATNQDGELSAVASAVVRLPSR